MTQDKTVMPAAVGQVATLLRLLGGIACGLAVSVSAVSAQSPGPEAPLTTEQTLALLPDPERYRLVILDDGLTPQAVQDIGTMIIDGIGEDHFFGAIAAHVPANSQQLAVSVRAKFHSLEAAERAALSDCEEERTEEASDCRLIGQIEPEEWDEDTPQLSHDVMCALDQGAGEMDGPIFVARSRNTAALAIWSGDDTRQSALDECNDAASATGAEPDCDIVVDDAP
ncbi:hypothetical protein [Paracoccus sp. PAMC 22219]|uniref:hypothetical protein n=1 Tax=Paracoccus sp. PAMC 22219 TaxID=1569209 RepID=UPI0012E0442C|nr:hypothetical protein [Paracoccus sp. PAMC 22219]